MAKRTEKNQKDKELEKGNNAKSDAETKEQTDNTKKNKKSARLNFYLIYSALKKCHGKKLTANEILKLINNEYDIKMTKSTIQQKLFVSNVKNICLRG